MKKAKLNKCLSIILSVIMLSSLMVPAVSAAEMKEHQPLAQTSELLADTGFEQADPAPVPVDQSAQRDTDKWYGYQVSRTDEDCHEGAMSIKLNATGADPAIEHDVAGLEKGKEYTFSVWAKGTPASAVIGVKNYGGAEVKVPIQATEAEWKQNEVTFTYTGDAYPRVYVWAANMGGSTLYLDDANLVVKDETVKPEPNTGITGEYAPTDLLADPDFENKELSDTYVSQVGVWNNYRYVRQQDAVGHGNWAVVSEKATETTMQQDALASKLVQGATYEFSIWAKASGEKGDANPKIGVKNYGGTEIQKDLQLNTETWTKNTVEFVYEGSENPTLFVWTDYNSSEMQIYLDAADLKKIKDAEPEVPEIGVPPHSEPTTFYVANAGDDNNDGTSPETAFKTIDQLNRITYIPGDQILFKKGDTFTGAFKPKGSGTAENPVVIKSYGEGAKPILQPGKSWRGKVMKANGGEQTLVENVTYNGCIWLENVQGYEVRDLELSDPNYDPNNNRVNEFREFTAGVRVLNQNQGDLHHFVFDNLTIHGFRGPGSNIGKSSGGIQFNVLVDPDHRNDVNWKGNVPSAMHDIQVTNCEIYDCGRSGINFLNPWGRRQVEGDKWQHVNEGILPWHPYTNFYMANNIIHNIDGDGLIVDNVQNAVVEKNLCYNTAVHLGAMGAAVGFFNWNSDDTYFQYNEVFNVGKDATKQDGSGVPYKLSPGDAQGIEIDALNDRTWVQHNYVHDNRGGFMMWCNLAQCYPSYDGIIRYNISENDHMESHSIFHSFSEQYGSETYNNAFFLNPDTALKDGNVYMFHSTGSATPHKMYNNIFYLDGDTAYPANTFDDGHYDWRSNIFYNFTNLPQNDDPANPNIAISKEQLAENPLFVNPGREADSRNPVKLEGLEEMRKALAGYKLQENSPAVQAGVRLDSMNIGIPVGMTGETAPMTDFFGNAVAGTPDIGVHQSGMTALRVTSDKYAVDQIEKVITVPYGTTAHQLLATLNYDENVQVELSKVGAVLLENGDKLTAKLGEKTVIYTIKTDKLSEIPVEDLSATAGSEEKEQSQDVAGNVLKNDGSFWHSKWAGNDRDDQWITLQITKNQYKVTGLTYLPRQDGNKNGIITKYKVLASMNGKDWSELAHGDWAADSNRKLITFDAEQDYTYYKLVSVDSVGGFSSAQELRLLGYAVTENVKPEVPAAAKATVNGTTVEISWTAPQDSTNVAGYIVTNGDKVLAEVAANKMTAVIKQLAAGDYGDIRVYAVNQYGTRSDAAVVAAFHIHKLNHVAAKDATCIKAGNVEYWHCEACGKNFADQDGKTELEKVELAALGHKLVYVPGKAATTTESGVKEHWHCEACGKNFADKDGKTALDTVILPKLPEQPSQPNQSNQTNQSTQSNQPKPETAPNGTVGGATHTGDTTNLMIWVVFAIAALAGGTGVLVCMKKKS